MQEHSNTYHFYGPEDIKRYLNGGMNAQEMHDMEKAALKDPMLADAIDGFRNANDPVIHKHLNDIRAAISGMAGKENIRVPLPQKTSGKWWRWVAAACSLSLLAGSAWWFMQKESGRAPSAPIANVNRELSLPDTFTGTTEAGKPAEPVNTGAGHEMPSQKAAAVRENKPIAVLKKNNTPVAASEPQLKTAPPAVAAEISLADETPGIMLKGTAAPAMARNSSANGNSGYMTASVPHPVNYLYGKVTDKQGNPLPAATVSAPGNKGLLTKSDGSFMLPAADSSMEVSVDMTGYDNVVATLTPLRQNNIVLTEAKTDLNEIVVVGYSRQKKNTRSGAIGDFRKFQKQTENAWKNEVIYPEEGWAHFYESLGTGLGVDKSQANKILQIKFTVDDNGDPVNFEIVESPDEILAKKAIEMIRKTKWKNFKLDKNAVVKIPVN
ncbi:carboxypeptidase-like regulatory domain-containing protein [Niabella aquatica]